MSVDIGDVRLLQLLNRLAELVQTSGELLVLMLILSLISRIVDIMSLIKLIV